MLYPICFCEMLRIKTPGYFFFSSVDYFLAMSSDLLEFSLLHSSAAFNVLVSHLWRCF